MNALRLAGWVADRGRQVTVLCDPASPLGRAAASMGLQVRELISTYKYGDFSNARRIARICREDGIGYVMSTEGRDLLLMVLAKKFARSRFKFLHLQQMHVGGFKKDFFHTWEYRHLDAWIAPLPMYRARILEATRLTPEKVHVINLAIEIDRLLDSLPTKAEAREQLDLPKEATIVGTVGRLDTKKGQDDTIEAVATLRTEGHNLHALFVGDRTVGATDEFENRLDARIEELGIGDCVHFRPFMKDVSVAYSAMDIFGMTTHSETYGMVTVEAMTCGLPVVGSRDGGTLQLIDDGRTGLHFTPQDSGDLTAKLGAMVRDPDLAKQLGENAALEARKRFGHDIETDAFLKLIDGLG